MKKYKRLSSKILAVILSVTMTVSMFQTNVFASENVENISQEVSTIMAIDKLEDRFIPSATDDSVYSLGVPLNTPFEDLKLPSELTVTVNTTRIGSNLIEDELKDFSGESILGVDNSDNTTVFEEESTTSSDTGKATVINNNFEVEALDPQDELVKKETTVTETMQKTISVTWKGDREYKDNENSKVIYNAVLSEGYEMNGGIKLPKIYVFVGKQAREADIASGESGTCTWTIDAGRTLTIKPTSGKTGDLGISSSIEGIPWGEKKESILKVVVEPGVVANENSSYLFYGLCYCTEIDLAGLDTSKVTNMDSMFSFNNELISLDLTNFNTSEVTNMNGMFSDCYKLTTLILDDSFDTKKVTNMSGMFISCSELTSINLTNFNTSEVTDMSSMFNGCRKLTSLDLIKFNTDKVENMSQIFSNCEELILLDLTNFDTSEVTDMSNMFSNCKKLTSLNLTNFDTSKVTNMNYMFDGCEELITLDVTKFNTSKVTNMYGMFKSCKALIKLDLSSYDMSQCTGNYSMFYGDAIKVLNLPKSGVEKLKDSYLEAPMGDWQGKECTGEWIELGEGGVDEPYAPTGEVQDNLPNGFTSALNGKTIIAQLLSPVIEIGMQNGNATYGVVDSSTFTVTADNFGSSDPVFAPTVMWLDAADEETTVPSGVTTAFSETKDLLTIKTSATTPAGSYNFKVVSPKDPATGGNYKSTEATFTVSKGTFSLAPSKEVGVLINQITPPTGTVTLADIFDENVPDGAKINTITGAASNVLSVAPTAGTNDTTLSWTAKDNLTAEGATDTISVSIETDNYNDITATLTFKTIDKTVVSFDPRNGLPVTKVDVDKTTETVTLPEKPTWVKDGVTYTFVGWYTGIDGTGSLFDNNKLTSNTTVYAKWTKGDKVVRTSKLDLTNMVTTDKLSEQGWAWNKDSQTLTLSGLNINSEDVDKNDKRAIGIEFPKTGKNTIILTDGTENTVDVSKAKNAEYSAAIYSEGSLTIKTSGDGTPGKLKVVAGDALVDSVGIIADGVTIENGDIIATAGDSAGDSAGGSSVGISGGLSGKLWIKKGTVTATGKSSSGSGSLGSFGLFAKEITIDGGTVGATAGTSSNSNSVGICALDNIELNAGVITSKGELASIAGVKELVIDDGAVIDNNPVNINKVSINGGLIINTIVDASGSTTIKKEVIIKFKPAYEGEDATAPDSTPASKTKDSITIKVVTPPDNEKVEYAISTTNVEPKTGWQDSTTFTGLNADTTYYLFARVKGNADHKAGGVSAGTDIKTDISDAQKIAKAKVAADDAITSFVPTNATTAADIVALIEKAIKDIDITGVTVGWDTSAFNKTDATESSTGSITGTIKLTCGTDTGTVALNNKTINTLPSDPDGKIALVKSAIETALTTFDSKNATTDNDIMALVNTVITNTKVAGVTPSWDSTNGFKKTESTNSADGSIAGTIKLACEDKEGTVAVNLTIERTETQKLASAKEKVEEILRNFTATNETEAVDVITDIINELAGTGVTAEWSITEGFTKIPATIDTEGSITGTIDLKLNNSPDSVTVNLTIGKITDGVKVFGIKTGTGNTSIKLTLKGDKFKEKLTIADFETTGIKFSDKAVIERISDTEVWIIERDGNKLTSNSSITVVIKESALVGKGAGASASGASAKVYSLGIAHGQGTIEILPNRQYHTVGETVTLTAKANTGYSFSKWTSSTNSLGLLQPNANSATVTLTVPEEDVQFSVSYTSNSTDGGFVGGGGVVDNNPAVIIPTTPGSVNDITTAQIETKATVDSKGNGVVTISQTDMNSAINKAIETAKKNGTQDKGIAVQFVITTGAQSVNGLTLNLPKVTQERVINNKVQELSFIMESANITLEFNLATVTEINSQAKADVQINVKQLDSSKLQGAGKTAIGNRPVFDLTATYNNDKNKVTDFGSGKVAIEIPYKLQKGEKASGVKGIYVDGKGKVTYIEDTVYDAKREVAIFTTNHFSVYGIGYKESTIKTDYSYGKLRLRSDKTTKTSQKLSWEKVSTADGYVVYGAPCGAIGNMEKLTEIKKNSTTSWTNKDVKSGTYYKYVVKAYKVVDGKKKLVAVSKVIHTATQGSKKDNPAAITLNASKVNLTVNKKKKITAKVTPVLGGTINKHADVKFESSNKAIATVGADGTITAKKKGSCTVYVYAQNGIYKAVNVTVK